tara:strand:+ start:280 stop:510 length:231 start_codon:yes stop_codon:yes gene_type:complete
MRCDHYAPEELTGCDANARENKNRNLNDPICEVCGRELTGATMRREDYEAVEQFRRKIIEIMEMAERHRQDGDENE